MVFKSKSDLEVKVVEKFSFHLSGIPVFQKIEQRYLDYNLGYPSRIILKLYEQIGHNNWNNFWYSSLGPDLQVNIDRKIR